MTARITLDTVLKLDTSPDALKNWLVSYHISQHPEAEPSVWWTPYDSGEINLNYHPPGGRIIFAGRVIGPGILDLTRVSYPQDLEDYFDELLQAIRTRWQSPPSLPDFIRVVEDPNLARVLKRRWQEISRARRAKAYLAATILLGSILEGVLLAHVRQNPREANQATPAPRNRNDEVLPFSRWKLNDLIQVAFDCQWIGTPVKDFSLELRDYRNLIHPREQAQTGTYPDAHTCEIAQLVVEATIGDLLK
jgi:hypothetical protein